MKKSFVIFPALVLGLAALAQAQPAPTKVALIHIQQAIVSTKDGQKAQQDLQARFGPKRSALEKKQADLAAMQETLKKGAATMSDDAKAKIAKDIEKLTTQLTREGEDFDAEVQQEDNKIMNDIGTKMMEVVTKYAIQNTFAMVLDISNQQTVLWADPSANITAECIKLYDQAHPGTGAAPAPAVSAPKPGVTPSAPPRSTPPATPPTKKQ